MLRLSGHWAFRSPVSPSSVMGSSPGGTPSLSTLPLVGMARRVLTRVSGLIAGYRFNRQVLTNEGIAELLAGSPDDQFHLVGMLSRKRT
jgi:hypothetical protein